MTMKSPKHSLTPKQRQILMNAHAKGGRITGVTSILYRPLIQKGLVEDRYSDDEGIHTQLTTAGAMVAEELAQKRQQRLDKRDRT